MPSQDEKQRTAEVEGGEECLDGEGSRDTPPEEEEKEAPEWAERCDDSDSEHGTNVGIVADADGDGGEKAVAMKSKIVFAEKGWKADAAEGLADRADAINNIRTHAPNGDRADGDDDRDRRDVENDFPRSDYEWEEDDGDEDDDDDNDEDNSDEDDVGPLLNTVMDRPSAPTALADARAAAAAPRWNLPPGAYAIPGVDDDGEGEPSRGIRRPVVGESEAGSDEASVGPAEEVVAEAYLVDDEDVVDPALVVTVESDSRERCKRTMEKRNCVIMGAAAAIVIGAAAVLGALGATGRLGGGSVVTASDADADAAGRDGGGCPPLRQHCINGTGSATSVDASPQCWTQLACDLPAPLGDISVSISSDGNRLVVGSVFIQGAGLRNGQARAYELIPMIHQGSTVGGQERSTDNEIIQQAQDDGNGMNSNKTVAIVPLGGPFYGEAGDELKAVLSGDGLRLATVVSNLHANANTQGLVRVYEYYEEFGNWTKIGHPITGESTNDGITKGLALNFDGGIVAVGAMNAGGTGHARVYHYSASSMEWIKMGSNIIGEGGDDFFGRSVSLSYSGEILAVGAYNNGGNGYRAGHVRVFRYDGTLGDWIQMGDDIDGSRPGDQFGISTSLSFDGMTVAVSALGSDGADGTRDLSGSVRVLRYDATADMWRRLGDNDIHGDEAGDAVRGVSLSGDGRRVALSGGQQDSGKGYARVLEYVEEDDDDGDWETGLSLSEDQFHSGAVPRGTWRQVGGRIDAVSTGGGEYRVSVALAWGSNEDGEEEGRMDGAAVLAVGGADTLEPRGVVRLYRATTMMP